MMYEIRSRLTGKTTTIGQETKEMLEEKGMLKLYRVTEVEMPDDMEFPVIISKKKKR